MIYNGSRIKQQQQQQKPAIRLTNECMNGRVHHFHLSAFLTLRLSVPFFFPRFRFSLLGVARIRSQSRASCAVIRRDTSTVSMRDIRFFVSSLTWDQYFR
mmetsp:Transcript_22385/g.47256  ORF Transcript_22385/g.47256 Transcript_22385/m.47256 type:complete len:100 (+) Transcript_22385:524-823(+)